MRNNRTKFLGLLLSLIVLVFLFLLSRYQNKSGITGKPVAVTFTSNIYEHEETLKYKASVRFSYPLMESGLQSSSTKAFNDYMKGFVAGIFEEYRGWFNGVGAESYITGADLKDYEVIRADNSLISIRFDLSKNWEGMAHDAPFTKVINYSVKDSKNLSLPYLFRKDSNYLGVLSSLVKQKLIEEYKTDGHWDEYIMGPINEATKPEENNFEKFVIGKDYLLFIFDPYEITAYVFGTREAKIMFRELDGYLNEKYLN